jgi:hypothetical protein
MGSPTRAADERRRGRGRAVGLAVGLVLLLSLAGAASAGAAPWGFEQVTPPVKGAGALAYVDTFQSSPDGESFLYTNNSAWTDIPAESAPAYVRYLGWRGPESWHSVSLDPPYETGIGSQAAFDIFGVIGTSFNLKYAVVASTEALTPGATEGGGNIYLRDTKTRELTLIATSPFRVLSFPMNGNMGELGIKYVADDGKAVMFGAAPGLVPGAPEHAEEPTKPSAMYSWTPEDGLKAVTVMPGGEIVGGGVIGNGSETGPRDSMPHEGGLDHVYFQAYIETSTGISAGGLYVREGETTKPVSYSRITGDTTDVKVAGGDAVSNNGRYLLFHCTKRLTEDTPETSLGNLGALYRYDSADGSLEYIGIDGGYSTSQVIQMSQDGKTIAFQSEKALPVVGSGTPVEGRTNVYVWQERTPKGILKLAATLDGGSNGSSSANSLRMISENGRYLAFTDNSPTLLEQFGQATSSAACPVRFVGTPGPCDEVFVYDTESERLECASCRADGAPQAGNAGDTLNANQGYMRANAHAMRIVADDGTVFFTTRDGLLPADRNELEDVYAYKDGDLRLISRATPGYSARFLDATPDGKTVFISTDDPISPTDVDVSVDVYMTREGAGYPYTPPVVTPPCSGLEACHAGVPGIPAQSSAGSSSFQGRGNETPSTDQGGKVRVGKARPAVGTTGVLKVRAPGKGRLTVTGHGVKKAGKSVSKAGTYKVKVTLTPAARKALKKSGHARKKLKVTFRPSQGKASSATVKLTFKASTGKKKGGR